MSRNFDLSQAANDGVTVLPDLTTITPTKGDVLTVGTIVSGQVFTTFAPPASVTGSFLPLTGGTLTGPLTLAADPASPLEAAPRQYIDAKFTALQPIPAGASTLPLMDAVPAQIGASGAYARADHQHPQDTSKLSLTGGTLTGPLVLAADPTNALQAATKAYVDTKVASTPSGASLTVSDTPPALSQGAMWFDSLSTQLYIGYNDGTSSQWVIATNSDLGGAYIPISGGTLTGPLTLASDPTAPLHAAPKRYVDNAINLAGNYLGTWSVAANTPNISAGGSISNANYVATTVNPATPETVPVGVPGIAGMTVNNGDRIIWAAGLSQWQILRNAGVTLAAADARYVALAGSTMTGALTLPGNAASALQAVPLQQVPVASSTTPIMDGTATIGVGTTWARADHTHPTDTSRYAASNPSGYQTAAQVTTAVTPTLNNVGRNLLHNPLYAVAQRGAGPWTVSASYTADRWAMYVTLDTLSVQQLAAADADRTQLGDEALTYVLNANVTGNAGASAFSEVTQRIEDVRRLAGKTVTVSFYGRYTSGTPKLGVGMWQSFGTGGSPSANVFLAGQAVTITAVWTRYSVTFTVPSIVGKTLGTNNDSFTALEFWFSSGTTQATRAGSIGVQTGIFQLWGAQLEIGSVATPLEKPDPVFQLQQAQRFYAVISALVPAVAAPSNLVLPVTMRASPTIAGGGAGFTTANLSNAAATVSQTAAASQTLTFSADL